METILAAISLSFFYFTVLNMFFSLLPMSLLSLSLLLRPAVDPLWREMHCCCEYFLAQDYSSLKSQQLRNSSSFPSPLSSSWQALKRYYKTDEQNFFQFFYCFPTLNNYFLSFEALAVSKPRSLSWLVFSPIVAFSPSAEASLVLKRKKCFL